MFIEKRQCLSKIFIFNKILHYKLIKFINNKILPEKVNSFSGVICTVLI